MPVQYPFNDWLAEMSAESLELPEGTGAGAIANMWSMSFGAERLPDSAELKRFIDGALELRRSQAQKFEGAPLTFYLWHDEQAGQLRFSVARCMPGTLAFRRSLTAASSMDEIVDEFLASTRVDGRIPWSELELEDEEGAKVAVDSELLADDQPLLVWARQLV